MLRNQMKMTGQTVLKMTGKTVMKMLNKIQMKIHECNNELINYT